MLLNTIFYTSRLFCMFIKICSLLVNLYRIHWNNYFICVILFFILFFLLLLSVLRLFAIPGLKLGPYLTPSHFFLLFSYFQAEDWQVTRVASVTYIFHYEPRLQQEKRWANVLSLQNHSEVILFKQHRRSPLQTAWNGNMLDFTGTDFFFIVENIFFPNTTINATIHLY